METKWSTHINSTKQNTTTTVNNPTPMKPQYDKDPSSASMINVKPASSQAVVGLVEHQITPNTATAALLEMSPEPPAQDSLTAFERTPLQTQMLKAYLGQTPPQNSAFQSSANLPTPNSLHTGNFGSVVIPMPIQTQVLPSHQLLSMPIASLPSHSLTHYASSFTSHVPNRHPQQPIIDQSFMPHHSSAVAGGSRGNNYMAKLKKQVQQKKSTATAAAATGSQKKAMGEDVQKGKQKMRKYIERAREQTKGYNAMVSLNGGDCVGEQDKNLIEKCIGIGPSPKNQSQRTSEKKPKENVLNKLQDEQREIEAKLKFIDGLINQQAPTNNYNVKYLGGGILKRQRTDDFVINLEQYQKAMLELKQTMDNLKGSIIDSDQCNQQDVEFELQHRYHGLTKSNYSDEHTENQTYHQQIEDAIARQSLTQSRQVLNLGPNGKKTTQGGTNEDVSILSSPSSNRLKEATLQRKSFDSHRLNKDSFRSSSFVLNNKLEHVPGQPDTNYSPGTLSPEGKQIPIKQALEQNTTSQSQQRVRVATPDKETSRERPQSCTLRVITEVIINGKGEDDDDKDGGDKGDQVVYQNSNAPPLLEMNKINMTFDQAAAPNGIENSRKTLYQSKAFQARTPITHPNFVGPNIIYKEKDFTHQNSGDIHYDYQDEAITIQNVLPISQGLEIKPSIKHIPKAPLTPLNGEHKENTHAKKRYYGITQAGERPTTVPVDDHMLISDVGKKPGTSLGGTNTFLPRANSGGLEVIDNNVVYQQGEDNTRGVLYFNNIDSLKSFIMNKKRPIFSKQGDRIISNAATCSMNSSTSNLQLKKKKMGPEELSKEIEADIQKKRQYLHNTLSTLMPQLQMKALREQERKLNFQQTVDVVQRKYLGQQIPASAPPGLQWPSQTVYNPIPKTSYLFDDIMTADGIIDLRFTVGTPNTNFYKPRLFSRQENGSQILNSRGGDGSPGGNNRRTGLPKRLQNFYQYSNLDNYQHYSAPGSKQGPKPENKSRNGLGNLVSDTMSESQGTTSSHNITRQVVFFKTTGQSQPNMRQETGGSYNMQYPHLRPRLEHGGAGNGAMSDTVSRSISKGPSSLTVHHQQKYMKTGAVTTSSFVQIPQTSLKEGPIEGPPSPEVVLDPIHSSGKFEGSLVRMSKDIEKSKIRLSQNSVLAGPAFAQMDEEKNGLIESQKLRQSSTTKNIMPLGQRKHVIFSTYDGHTKDMQSKPITQKNFYVHKKIPPLYPQQPNKLQSSTVITNIWQEKQASHVSRKLTTINFNTVFPQDNTNNQTVAQTNENCSLKSRALTVSPKSRQAGQFFANGGTNIQLSPKRWQQDNNGGGGADRNGGLPQASSTGSMSKRGGGEVAIASVRNGTNMSSRANNKKQLKGLIGPENQTKSKEKRMDLSITQSKFQSIQAI